MTASLLLLALLALDTAPAFAQARGRVAPRGGSPQIGRATPRVGPPPRAVRPIYRDYGYRYRPGVRLGIYTGYGFGYPYGFSSYSGYPYGYYGYGYSYPYYTSSPYRYGHSGYYGASRWGTHGGVRIRGAQPNAEVLVDGYYTGIVDDFDGAFQQLNLEAGVHHIEIRTPNGPSLTFDVNVIPGQTITYRAQP